MDYKTAEKLLENGKKNEVREYFKKNNYLLEYGYCLLLGGELDSAKEILAPLTSTRAEWAVNIIALIKNVYGEIPTYFQIRNFLEIDISLFIKYKKFEYVQKILDSIDFFQEINPETYKFVGRALLKNNYMGSAKILFDKSCSEYYNDVELHYLYAEFYLAHNDKENALKAVNTCLRLNPSYYPAVRTYRELTTLKMES